MDAVDCADHYCVSYSFTSKMVEETFFFATGGVCCKFFYPVQESNRTTRTQALSRKNLILQFVKTTKNSNAKKQGRPSLANDRERLCRAPHFITNAGSGHNKICMVGSTCQQQKITVYYCETCSRKPGLHSGKCFKIII